MWIYEQTGPENALPELPVEGAPVSVPAVPETSETGIVAAPTEKIVEPPIRARRTGAFSRATRDCWFLAAAFLLGSMAAGILRAVCDSRQTALLGYYLDTWCSLFTAGDPQNAVRLFGAEYIALGVIVSLFLLLGLSALGPLLIFACMMLYGLGNGLLFVQLADTGGWRALLAALLWTGIPTAAATGCLCLFGAFAVQVSGRIRAYSFWNRSAGQARPGVQALLGQYLLTMVLLLPLCGAAAGLSYLGGRF